MRAAPLPALACALALGTGAIAAEARLGWRVEFRQDLFDKAVFPVAMIAEAGESIDKATLAFACDAAGELVAFIQPHLWTVAFQPETVAFRAGGIAHTVEFVARDVPRIGRRLTATTTGTEQVMQLVIDAAGADVAFRASDKQGVFGSVAATDALAITKLFCRR